METSSRTRWLSHDCNYTFVVNVQLELRLDTTSTECERRSRKGKYQSLFICFSFQGDRIIIVDLKNYEELNK